MITYDNYGGEGFGYWSLDLHPDFGNPENGTQCSITIGDTHSERYDTSLTVGDVIYGFRDGGLRFRSRDHSLLQGMVDAGWAENEAGRLLDAARTTGHSCVWLLFGHMREGAYRPLREALVRDHAGQVTWSKSFPGAAAARICFPSS